MSLKLHWAWLVPVLLLSAFLALVMINYDALWFDEWITLFISGTGNFTEPHREGTICESFLTGDTHGIGDTLCIAAIDNSWPPLYFLMQMVWNAFVSQGHYFVDRCLALLIGLLAISATFRLGRSLYDLKTGLLAGLLLASSVFLTFYMHEIRGYTLYVFTSALNGLLYWHLLSHPKTGRALRWGFALSILASLYTHYISIAVVFGIGVYHVFFQRPPMLFQQLRQPEEKRSLEANNWLKILKLYINGSVLYALWIGVLVISYVNSALLDRGIPLHELLSAMVTGFSNNLSILALILLGLSLLYWKERQVRFLWVWSICILIVAALGNIYADFLFHPRHIMGMMPAFMLLLAVAIQRIPKFRLGIGAAIMALWVGAGIFYANNGSLMELLPMQMDTVPLSAMDSIVDTAEQCGTSENTFVLGINAPNSEWVQDHPVTYYLGDFGMPYITLGRIMSQEWVEKQISPLLSDELEAGTVQDRFDYFTDAAEVVFLFTLPNRGIEQEIADFEALMSEAGFVACENLYERSDLLGQVFVRDAAQCETILASCR